jgi:hypothetical protein
MHDVHRRKFHLFLSQGNDDDSSINVWNRPQAVDFLLPFRPNDLSNSKMWSNAAGDWRKPNRPEKTFSPGILGFLGWWDNTRGSVEIEAGSSITISKGAGITGDSLSSVSLSAVSTAITTKAGHKSGSHSGQRMIIDKTALPKPPRREVLGHLPRRAFSVAFGEVFVASNGSSENTINSNPDSNSDSDADSQIVANSASNSLGEAGEAETGRERKEQKSEQNWTNSIIHRKIPALVARFADVRDSKDTITTHEGLELHIEKLKQRESGASIGSSGNEYNMNLDQHAAANFTKTVVLIPENVNTNSEKTGNIHNEKTIFVESAPAVSGVEIGFFRNDNQHESDTTATTSSESAPFLTALDAYVADAVRAYSAASDASIEEEEDKDRKDPPSESSAKLDSHTDNLNIAKDSPKKQNPKKAPTYSSHSCVKGPNCHFQNVCINNFDFGNTHPDIPNQRIQEVELLYFRSPDEIWTEQDRWNLQNLYNMVNYPFIMNALQHLVTKTRVRVVEAEGDNVTMSGKKITEFTTFDDEWKKAKATRNRAKIQKHKKQQEQTEKQKEEISSQANTDASDESESDNPSKVSVLIQRFEGYLMNFGHCILDEFMPIHRSLDTWGFIDSSGPDVAATSSSFRARTKRNSNASNTATLESKFNTNSPSKDPPIDILLYPIDGRFANRFKMVADNISAWHDVVLDDGLGNGDDTKPIDDKDDDPKTSYDQTLRTWVTEQRALKKRVTEGKEKIKTRCFKNLIVGWSRFEGYYAYPHGDLRQFLEYPRLTTTWGIQHYGGLLKFRNYVWRRYQVPRMVEWERLEGEKQKEQLTKQAELQNDNVELEKVTPGDKGDKTLKKKFYNMTIVVKGWLSMSCCVLKNAESLAVFLLQRFGDLEDSPSGPPVITSQMNYGYRTFSNYNENSGEEDGTEGDGNVTKAGRGESGDDFKAHAQLVPRNPQAEVRHHRLRVVTNSGAKLKPSSFLKQINIVDWTKVATFRDQVVVMSETDILLGFHGSDIVSSVMMPTRSGAILPERTEGWAPEGLGVEAALAQTPDLTLHAYAKRLSDAVIERDLDVRKIRGVVNEYVEGFVWGNPFREKYSKTFDNTRDGPKLLTNIK